MSRKTIAIDIDDVLAEHAKALVEFSNETYGTNLTIEDYNDHWSKMWQVDTKERERRAKAFHGSDKYSFGSFLPKQGADLALLKLAQRFKLALVTARPEWMMQVSLAWLEQHYPNIEFETHFITLWEDENAPSKAEICKKIGADYLIDDLASHCNIAADGAIKALLFGDYAWNRNEKTTDGVVRVKNWQAVLEFFEHEG